DERADHAARQATRPAVVVLQRALDDALAVIEEQRRRVQRLERVLHRDQEGVALRQPVGHVEPERREGTFVMTEVLAVQPHVSEIVDGGEAKSDTRWRGGQPTVSGGGERAPVPDRRELARQL